MSAMSHDFDLPLARDCVRDGAHFDVASLAARWDAVHEAAVAVGALAQLGAEPEDDSVAALPERAAQAGSVRREAIVRGIDDLAAILEPGLRALLDLTAKGHDTTAAALTLWREFHTARSAIVALAPAD